MSVRKRRWRRLQKAWPLRNTTHTHTKHDTRVTYGSDLFVLLVSMYRIECIMNCDRVFKSRMSARVQGQGGFMWCGVVGGVGPLVLVFVHLALWVRLRLGAESWELRDCDLWRGTVRAARHCICICISSMWMVEPRLLPAPAPSFPYFHNGSQFRVHCHRMRFTARPSRNKSILTKPC